MLTVQPTAAAASAKPLLVSRVTGSELCERQIFLPVGGFFVSAWVMLMLVGGFSNVSILAWACALPPPPPPALALPPPPPPPLLLLFLLLLQAAAPPTVSVRATKTPMIAFRLNIPATPSFEWGCAPWLACRPRRRNMAGRREAVPPLTFT